MTSACFFRIGTVTLLSLVASAFVLPASASDVFTKPTKEELAMTELPGYPGVAAVVLNHDEYEKDDLHMYQYYDRIKVLTEKGKSYANVELGFTSERHYMGTGDDVTISGIEGRTIHSDGTIIPFTGKPYLKTIAQEVSHGERFTYQARVFTLPDVEVGSIIEYRYTLRINDGFIEIPTWYVQRDIYVKAAHFLWYPTREELMDTHTGAPVDGYSWFPILPAGAKVDRRTLANVSQATGDDTPQQVFELTIKDVPPSPHEEFMPPIESFTYRVLFNRTEYHSAAEYWTGHGKDWSHRVDTFINGNSDGIRTEAQSITAGATTSQDKLRNIYGAVQALENTHYTRKRTESEDKASGLGKIKNAYDVLQHKHGSAGELTDLFIALARAAGFNAYAMLVPDRARTMFLPNWLNMEQLDGKIAIVSVDGKDMYFDPGERYCKYGHLAWQHTLVQGLRQVDGGTSFAQTPSDTYKENSTARVAKLTLDDGGIVSGAVDVTYMGVAAMEWRQRALEGDEESLHDALRHSLERVVPSSVSVKVGSIAFLTDYEKPLIVNYEIKGAIGMAAGKRLSVPADLFAFNQPATFPDEKRDIAVYFPFPQTTQDVMKLKLPPTLAVDALPDPKSTKLPSRASYDIATKIAGDTLTTRRTFVFADVVIPVADYTALRAFYSDSEAKDQESVLLKTASATPNATSSGGMN